MSSATLLRYVFWGQHCHTKPLSYYKLNIVMTNAFFLCKLSCESHSYICKLYYRINQCHISF